VNNTVDDRTADHGSKRGLKRRRRSGESGASLVEAAVIILPFLALFTALFDFSMALFLQNTMQFAVRQGVRYAVTSQVQNGLGQDDSIRAQVNTFSFGFLSYVAPGPPKTACAGTACVNITYYHQDLSVTPSTLTAVAGASSNAAGNVVQVSANNLVYTWMMPLSPQWWQTRNPANLTFSVSSADIMEAQPNGPPAR
jgi:Flp pilus assembly protein TadG